MIAAICMKGMLNPASYFPNETVPRYAIKSVNMSYHFGTPNALEKSIIDFLGQEAVMVASAGNESNALDYYPAAYPIVISVTAHDHNGNRWSGANYASSVDISAPGVAIPTTDMAGTSQGEGEILGYGSGRYWTQTGTSFSAPHVAAVAAMIADKYPAATAAQIRAQIINTQQRLYPGNPFGGLNAAKALAANP
jgi:subtilisin family serine protease